MKKTLCLIFFTSVLVLCNLIYTYAGTVEMKHLTVSDILKEMNLLKDKLSSMDIYTEPVEKGYLQIEKYVKDGKNIIVKTMFNKNGDVISRDKYVSFLNQLIWEHEEKGSEHFIISTGKNGILNREDITFASLPTFTPSPAAPQITPVPVITPAQQIKPLATPTVHISSTPFSTVKSREKVIFVSDLDGFMNIYTINPDGSELYKITKEKYEKAFPAISPDGMKIIYSGNKDGIWSIYTINLDGTGEKRITNSGSNDIMPCFIDKNNIIFQSFRDRKPAIYRMALDTKKLSLLTADFALAIHPVLYPDRKKFIFVGERDGNSELYSMDIDGKNLKILTHSGFEKSFPSISPDGKKIVFCGNSNGLWSLYTLSQGGQKKINTGFKESACPSWTCDGKYIVFQALEQGNIRLFKINPSAEKPVKLTDNNSDSIQAKCQFITVK